MKALRIPFRLQIMSLLGFFVLLVGFFSFRSTYSFLEDEKVASIREVQTLKIDKTGLDVSDKLTRLSAELVTLASNPLGLQAPAPRSGWLWISLDGQAPWISAQARTMPADPFAGRAMDPNKLEIAFDNVAGRVAVARFVPSRQVWARGQVDAQTLFSPITSLNQGPIRSLVLDLNPNSRAAHLRDRVVFNTIAPQEKQAALAQELLSQAPASMLKSSVSSSGEVRIADDTIFVSWTSVPHPEVSSNIQILSFASKNDIYAAFRRFIYEQAFLIFLILGASVFVAIRFSNYLSSPLEKLVDATKLLKTGDFTVRVGIKRLDEIGELADAFNAMSEGLKQREEALRNAQSSMLKIEMKTEVMKKLSEFTSELAKTLNFEDLKIVAARGISEAFCKKSLAHAIYFRYNDENKSFNFDTAFPNQNLNPVEHLPLTVHQILGFDLEKAMETGQVELSTASMGGFKRFFASFPNHEKLDLAPARWKLVVVRSNKNRPHGMLLFQADSWDEESPALANRYQFVIESTFDNALIHEEIREVSMRDGLTGLFNVRHFKQLFLEDIRRAQASGEQLSFLFLDVDHFKKFNDTHGHPGGDRVLKQMSSLMRDCFSRKTDLIARYGGEEFVVLLKNTSGEEAMLRAEQFRKTVEADKFEGEETQPLGRLTVSIGVSTFPLHGKNMSEVIQAADDALYESKKTSRNTVTYAKLPKANSAAS